MSRALRLAIGLAGLILVIGIAGGALVAAGVEGAAVAWISLGVGALWIAFVIWWARQAPEGKKPSSVWRPPNS